MIGIVSHDGDLHAAAVRGYLEQAGAPVVRLDTADMPASVGLTAWTDPERGWSGEWGLDGIDVSTLNVMWWRRPQPFVPPAEVTSHQDKMFLIGECAAAVSGLWTCLDAVWVNDPDRDEAASRKMWQLKVASQIGLRMPRTCMTNSPERARQFLAAEPDAAIFKAFSATPETWRVTRAVGALEHELIEQVRFAPVIFQEAIPGGCDIRVTVVGDQMFPAEIISPEKGYEYDFRLHTAEATIRPHVLPEVVRAKLHALMRRLELWYGAIDLRRTPDGDYVFLEINPAGQWLFVEYATEQPISEALAGLLNRLDSRTACAA